MRCSACQGELEPGFLPDFGTAATWVAIWVSGEPGMRKSVWERLRTGAGVGVDQAEDVKMVDAHRCKSCGHLELYATRTPDEGTTPARR